LPEERRRRPRRCVGCGAEMPKRGLIRVVRTPDGRVSLDRTGKMPGRGAYICPSPSCLAMAAKKRSLSRALRVEVPPEVMEEIGALLREAEVEGDG